MEPTLGILSAAYYLPPTRKQVADVFRDEELPSESLAVDIDFERDIGIDTVHMADELPSEMAIKVAREAVAKAGIDPINLDLVLDFTSIPEDYVAPTWSAAGLVQHELGARRALATAVNTEGCASYHVALRSACALLAANDRFETALLFSADKTPELNHVYYPITVTCDGASAFVLKKHHQRRVILAVETATVGRLHDVWYMPGIAHRDPGEPESEKHLYMHSDLARFNSDVIPINLFMFRRVMKLAMKKAGVSKEDIDYYVYPTFSTWDQKSFMGAFEIPPEKIYTESLGRHGHLQENDMVINYVDAAEEGHLREGNLVMVVTNGAGFFWAAAIIRH